MDRAITRVAPSAADRRVQRRREAYAIYARLRGELAALDPAHPARPALRVAVREAEWYWQATIDAEMAAEAATHVARWASAHTFNPHGL